MTSSKRTLTKISAHWVHSSVLLIYLLGSSTNATECGIVGYPDLSKSGTYVVEMNDGTKYQIRNLELMSDHDVKNFVNTLSSITFVHLQSNVYSIRWQLKTVKLTRENSGIGSILNNAITGVLNAENNSQGTIVLFGIRGRCLDGKSWSLNLSPDRTQISRIYYIG